MIKNSSKNQIEKFLQLNKSFIVCTYYVDSFSNFYAAMMNKYLEKDLINLYYLEVNEFMELFPIKNNIFPIFSIITDGKLSKTLCGFIKYHELFNEFTKKVVPFL